MPWWRRWREAPCACWASGTGRAGQGKWVRWVPGCCPPALLVGGGAVGCHEGWAPAMLLLLSAPSSSTPWAQCRWWGRLFWGWRVGWLWSWACRPERSRQRLDAGACCKARGWCIQNWGGSAAPEEPPQRQGRWWSPAGAGLGRWTAGGAPPLLSGRAAAAEAGAVGRQGHPWWALSQGEPHSHPAARCGGWSCWSGSWGAAPRSAAPASAAAFLSCSCGQCGRARGPAPGLEPRTWCRSPPSWPAGWGSQSPAAAGRRRCSLRRPLHAAAPRTQGQSSSSPLAQGRRGAPVGGKGSPPPPRSCRRGPWCRRSPCPARSCRRRCWWGPPPGRWGRPACPPPARGAAPPRPRRPVCRGRRVAPPRTAGRGAPCCTVPGRHLCRASAARPGPSWGPCRGGQPPAGRAGGSGPGPRTGGCRAPRSSPAACSPCGRGSSGGPWATLLTGTGRCSNPGAAGNPGPPWLPAGRSRWSQGRSLSWEAPGRRRHPGTDTPLASAPCRPARWYRWLAAAHTSRPRRHRSASSSGPAAFGTRRRSRSPSCLHTSRQRPSSASGRCWGACWGWASPQGRLLPPKRRRGGTFLLSASPVCMKTRPCSAWALPGLQKPPTGGFAFQSVAWIINSLKP